MFLAKGNLYIFCSFLHLSFALYLILGSNAGINLGLDSSQGEESNLVMVDLQTTIV